MRAPSLAMPRARRTGFRVIVSTASIVGILVAGLVATPVSAATYNVSVGCGTGRVAKLVRVLVAANNRASSDRTVVSLAAGCTYTLTKAYNSPGRGPDGLPPIGRRVAIEGHGATITRSAAAPRFRIFAIKPAGRLTLNDLTISNGGAARGLNGSNRVNEPAGDGTDGKHGGGLHNQGTLVLDGVTVAGNSAGRGGHGGSATGTTAGNGAANASGAGDDGQDARDVAGGDGGDGGLGGGIYNTGTLLITDSTITGNTAGLGGQSGGATAGAGGTGGNGTTQGGSGGDGGNATSGAAGRGGDGGGIYSTGNLTIVGSTLGANTAGDAGTPSVASGGDGGDGGQGSAGPGGAGGAGGAGEASIEASRAGDGGAIRLVGGSATIDASVIQNNSAGDVTGVEAIGGDGGDGGDGIGTGGDGGNGGSATGGSAFGAGQGGIASTGISPTVTNTSFSGNTGGQTTGGSATGGATGAGGDAL